jgi:arylsulfatase A
MAAVAEMRVSEFHGGRLLMLKLTAFYQNIPQPPHPNRMKFLTFCTLLLGLLSAAASAAEKPNIIFILADDLGINGVSCYGADARKTPQIDKLAASGIRFETCYASPLCGPTRCLLMSGRYAFRTGGLGNQSWRAGGPGAQSKNEHPVAALLKQSGYATAAAGKWRQVGETPKDWGFDEYTTDPTAGGWYWQTKHQQNGKEVTKPEGTYAPDVVHEFAVDFIRRNKDKPFFLYYSMHTVHGPILRTPDSAKGETNPEKLYNDNIAYMDKQVGAMVAELEKLGLREKTLLIFSGDNGTAAPGRGATVKGRALNGMKASMLEGGSRVPFIASWPGVTPAGKVLPDIISFADPHATFVDLACGKLPDNFTFDGRSFAPQLRGEKGSPRDWAYVQLNHKWFVREPGYKMNESGELYDMSDAPFVEKLVESSADTEQSKAARQRLAKVLADLNPNGGKTDNPPLKAKKGAGKMKKNAAPAP